MLDHTRSTVQYKYSDSLQIHERYVQYKYWYYVVYSTYASYDSKHHTVRVSHFNCKSEKLSYTTRSTPTIYAYRRLITHATRLN